MPVRAQASARLRRERGLARSPARTSYDGDGAGDLGLRQARTEKLREAVSDLGGSLLGHIRGFYSGTRGLRISPARCGVCARGSGIRESRDDPERAAACAVPPCAKIWRQMRTQEEGFDGS